MKKALEYYEDALVADGTNAKAYLARAELHQEKDKESFFLAYKRY